MKLIISKFTLLVVLGYTAAAVGQSVLLDRFDTVSAASNYGQAIQQARAEIQVLIDAGALDRSNNLITKHDDNVVDALEIFADDPLLLAPPLLPNGTIADQSCGLGWVSLTEDGAWVGHTGGSVGGNTLFMGHAERNAIVAVVCNLTGCLGANRKLRDIGNLFLQ